MFSLRALRVQVSSGLELIRFKRFSEANIFRVKGLGIRVEGQGFRV